MKDAKILVVEDDTSIQAYLERKLTSYGYQVIDVISSGEEAIQKTSEKNPDLVIMDIALEGKIDGVQAASVIRYRYDIPVVYLTASSDDETILRVKDTDPFGFIVKPIIDKDFYMTLELALFKHHKEKELRLKEQQYLDILQLVKCAIIAVDQNDNIIFMNAEAESFLKMNFHHIKGSNIFETLNLDPLQIKSFSVCTKLYVDSEPLNVKIMISKPLNHDALTVMVILPDESKYS